jgi:hypothetical protein
MLSSHLLSLVSVLFSGTRLFEMFGMLMIILSALLSYSAEHQLCMYVLLSLRRLSRVLKLVSGLTVPIAVLLVRGRPLLPIGDFPLGKFWGPVCNIFGLVFVIITTIFFVFPPCKQLDEWDRFGSNS